MQTVVRQLHLLSLQEWSQSKEKKPSSTHDEVIKLLANIAKDIGPTGGDHVLVLA